MTQAAGHGTLKGVLAFGRFAAVSIAAFIIALAAARADVTTLDGTDAPIVRVNVRHGNVTVRTWNRPTVSVDADPSLLVERRTAHENGQPAAILIPRVAQAANGGAELPLESFVLSPFPPGDRESIVVRSPPGDTTVPAALTPETDVTVTVPADTVFVFAHTADGVLDVRDYRSGTFVGFVGRGRMLLVNLGGTAFAQTNRGPLVVQDSSFDRLRTRSLYGNMTFERCNVRQIEATDIAGSIVFDDGAFEPGLARFDSMRGTVAVGALGPVQLNAHTGGFGRVYTSFTRGARVSGEDGQASAEVGSSGPVVTATTERGNVYLYDGSLRGRPMMPPVWLAPLGVLDRPANPQRPGQMPGARGAFPFARPFGPRSNLQRPPGPGRRP
jgi:hypothetical protein